MTDSSLPSSQESHIQVPTPPSSEQLPSALVFGVLGLIIAVTLGFCCLGGLIPLSYEAEDRFDELMQQQPFAAIHIGLILIGQFFNLLLLAGSVGLLMRANWGRLMLIAYGGVAPLLFLVHVVATTAWVYLPGMQAADQEVVDTSLGLMLFHLVLGGPLLFVFPVVLLIFMLRPSFRAALTGRARTGGLPYTSY